MKPRSKYEPLYQLLISSGKDEITLSFTKIERLIGDKLPESAYKRSWWSNRKTGLQASTWIEAGYQVEDLDLTEKRITFRKPIITHSVQHDETGTVIWTAELIKALRQYMGLSQAKFAEEIGVRQQTVSEWEQDVYIPTRATAKHLTLVAKHVGFALDK